MENNRQNMSKEEYILKLNDINKKLYGNNDISFKNKYNEINNINNKDKYDYIINCNNKNINDKDKYYNPYK